MRKRFLSGIQKIESYGVKLDFVTLKKGKRRFRISISVPKANSLVITANGLSDEQINKVLLSHAKWVYLRLKKYEEKLFTLNFGDKITLFNKEYTIKKGDNCLTDDAIYVCSEEQIKGFLLDIMTSMTAEYMPEITKRIAEKYSFAYNKIGVTKDKSKWGYCNVTKKEIRYNRLVALVSDNERQYIAVHELCHLKQLGHTPYFWSLVESIMPDYKKYRKVLKKSTPLIDFFSS